MNYQESLNLITSQEKFHINLGLERMKKLAGLFFNPQDDLKIVHVAGTNGKGSTCAMIAKVCETNGLRAGLFTSPHIKNYTERIKINFQNISENDFAKYTQMVENKAKENNISLTEFEILTMIAFLYFKNQKTDIVILETGMGGRLDATNIIKKPVLTIITSISFDHKDKLGNTIEKIATEKAGIIKENVPVIVSKNNLGFDVIKNKAENMNTKIILPKKDFELSDIKNNIFSNGEISYKLSLRGINQGQNLALVNEAIKYLNLKENNTLENIFWSARFEYIKEKNLIIDAAHNPDGVRLLKENLNIYYNGQKRAYLFGALNTKDYKSIITNLFSDDDEIFVTDNFAHNAIKKEILLNEIKKQYPKINAKIIDLEDINKFLNYDFCGIKICCGSFYLCSKIY